MLLVEPGTYSVVLTENQTYPESANDESGPGGKRGKRGGKSQPKGKGKKKTSKDYARERGRFRGGRNEDDELGVFKVLEFDELDPTEGMYIFVQSGTCRRQVLAVIFENPKPGKFLYILATKSCSNLYQLQQFLAATSAVPNYSILLVPVLGARLALRSGFHGKMRNAALLKMLSTHGERRPLLTTSPVHCFHHLRFSLMRR